MMKTPFSLLVPLLAGMLFTTSVSAAEKPNIIYVMVDDMGWADAGCYGSEAVRTPNIDRLAEAGMRFTNAYSGCTVCAPARSTLMTGIDMGRTSVRGNTGGLPLRDEDVTVAELLKQAGYATGGFGKWGLGDIHTEGVAEKQGFDTFFGYYHQIHAHNYYPSYLIKDGEHFPLPKNADLNDVKPKGPAVSGDRQFSAYLIFDEMQAFIREHQDGPFFCYAPWTPPHATYHMPEDDPAWQFYKDQPWPDADKVHAAFVTMIDRQLGETMALLEELGIADNTIVFFCSDNGSSGRHEGTLDSCGRLKGMKRSMYEGGIRTPFIAAWPGKIPAGSVSDLPTYFPDFLPTAAELAGVAEKTPAEVTGISILPTLLEMPEKQTAREFLYWEYPKYNWKQGKYIGNSQAVRHGKWKLVREDSSQPWELYDLTTDIGETHDLAAGHGDLVEKVDAWVTSHRTEPRLQAEPEMPEGRKYR